MYYICNYTYNYKGTDGVEYSDFDCSSIVRANSENEAIEKAHDALDFLDEYISDVQAYSLDDIKYDVEEVKPHN
jgi:hypothetical protein